MGRIARVVIPGVWHHVTQRGNHQQTVFFDDRDRALYLRLLARHSAKHGLTITGYCLMGNHVHILAIPAAENSLARALGRAHNDYARCIHARRGENGHLWQGRYFSCPLDERHQWEALRYVELNPVRAGMVSSAERWQWSSAGPRLEGADPYGILSLGEWRGRWSPEAWFDALAEGFADAAFAERIRGATRTGRPAGDDAFVAEVERHSGRQLSPQKRGRKKRAAGQPAQTELVIA